MATKPTTVAKTVSLSLGLATVFGSLRTVRNAEKAASFRSLCPGCLAEDPTTGVPVRQLYSCEHEHGPYAPSEVTAKGKQVGDHIIPLTDAELAAIADDGGGDDGKAMDLRIHPAEQFPPVARPTGLVYAFDPGPGKAEMVGVLLHMIAEGRWALTGELTVKKVRRIFRLVAAPHGIELAEIARPEDVFDLGSREYDVSPASMKMADMIAEAVATDYDPEMYRSGTADRLANVLATKTGGQVATVSALPRPATTGNDLEAMLAASLAAAQAAKAAA